MHPSDIRRVFAGAKVCAVLIVAFGLFGAYDAASGYLGSRVPDGWVVTDGTIVDFDTETRRGTSRFGSTGEFTACGPVVETVVGTTTVTTRPTLYDHWSARNCDLSVGDPYPVAYDPSDPTSSIIADGTSRTNNATYGVFSVVFVLGGLWTLYACYRRPHLIVRRDTVISEDAPTVAERTRWLGYLLLALAGSIVVGGLYDTYLAQPPFVPHLEGQRVLPPPPWFTYPGIAAGVLLLVAAVALPVRRRLAARRAAPPS